MDIAFPLMLVLFGAGLAAVITFLFGFYTIGPTERGVLTTFGKAQRIGGTTSQDPVLGALLEDDQERKRYDFPMIRVIQPGGPYFKWPWQKVIKIDMDTDALRYIRELIKYRSLVLMKRVRPGVYVTHPEGLVIQLETE